MSSDHPSWLPDPAAGEGVPSPSVLFDLLAHQYRRSTLWHLARTDGSLPVDDLAAHVASDLSRADAHIETVLHHTHLPKMEDAGMLEYDRDRQIVTLTALAHELRNAVVSF